jgi:hypothetical protein
VKIFFSRLFCSKKSPYSFHIFFGCGNCHPFPQKRTLKRIHTDTEHASPDLTVKEILLQSYVEQKQSTSLDQPLTKFYTSLLSLLAIPPDKHRRRWLAVSLHTGRYDSRSLWFLWQFNFSRRANLDWRRVFKILPPLTILKTRHLLAPAQFHNLLCCPNTLYHCPGLSLRIHLHVPRQCQPKIHSTSLQPGFVPKFDRSKPQFSVKAGSFTLLDNFSPSLTEDTILREYCDQHRGRSDVEHHLHSERF